jgi:GxxExxY protein
VIPHPFGELRQLIFPTFLITQHFPPGIPLAVLLNSKTIINLSDSKRSIKGSRMIQTVNYKEHFNRILEAEVLLVARAAKIVYQKIGGGFGENKYRQALQKEFEKKHIKYKKVCPEAPYRSEETFRPDFLCFGNLVLYSKVAAEITKDDRRQLKLCMQELNMPVGLIVNFGGGRLDLERVTR